MKRGMIKRESDALKGIKERIQRLSPQGISELRAWVLARFDLRGYDARYRVAMGDTPLDIRESWCRN